MLYRFKSRASQDFVMLEVHARQMLEIIGKPLTPQGIVTVAQIPAAISALEAAMLQESGNAHNNDSFAVESHANDAEIQHVGLRQRASPLVHMLKDSLEANKDVTWGT